MKRDIINLVNNIKEEKRPLTLEERMMLRGYTLTVEYKTDKEFFTLEEVVNALALYLNQQIIEITENCEKMTDRRKRKIVDLWNENFTICEQYLETNYEKICLNGFKGLLNYRFRELEEGEIISYCSAVLSILWNFCQGDFNESIEI